MNGREGQQLGKYHLVRLLGRGAFAEVYLGEHLHLKTNAAVKVLRTHLTESDAEAFLAEARTIAHLVHPSIVHILDFDVREGIPFLVMEYAPGGTLRQRHPRGTSLSLETITRYVQQIADAIHYAHSHRIVHRDIKPENILLNHSGSLLLSDFGIALLSQSTRTQTPLQIAGTAAYMAPEQFQGKALLSSDQYALGIMVYEWLCGERPFHGSFVELVSQHLLVAPPSFQEKSAVIRIPSPIEEVVMTALAKEPRLRFPSIRAFADAWTQAVIISTSSSPAVYPLHSSSPSLPSVPAVSAPPRVNPPVVPLPPTPLPSPATSLPPTPAGALITTDPPVEPHRLLPSANIEVSRQHATPSDQGLEQHLSSLPPQGPKIGKRYKLLAALAAIIIITGTMIAAFGPNLWTPKPPPKKFFSGIGITRTPDGENIGISDGRFPFDTDRPNGALKLQAAEKLKRHDNQGARSLWQVALQQETNDAETLIYLEDQRILASHAPYITFVIATLFTHDYVSYGRANLQGAYVLQKEYNDGLKLPGGVQIRLLVANCGSSRSDPQAYVVPIAQQIVQLAQVDTTVVGIMGWPFSTQVKKAIDVFGAAHIPVVSPSAYFDQLTGISPYLFHIPPSNKRQVSVGVQYVEHTLHATKVALFIDSTDTYSREVATDFEQQFTADGNTIVIEEYVVGNPGNLPGLLQDALTHNPDLIYFAGYAGDIVTLLAALPTTGPFANLQVFGANRLYASYPSKVRSALSRLHFTGLVNPNTWSFLKLSAQEPIFFSEYPHDFDPLKQHLGDPFGYTLADNDTMLSYDAMLALATASKIALTTKAGGAKRFSTNDLQKALTEITSTQTIQGVTGQISFGLDGTPTNKSVIILKVDSNGDAVIDSVAGSFLVGS